MTTSRRTHLRTDRTYLAPLPTWILWHMTKCGQDTYWEGYSLGRVTPTDRQTEGHTDRQIQKTEPSATRRPVRSAPGYFTSDRLFSWYCKVQFCRHTGATTELCKQVVDNACSLLTCRISVGRHRWRHCSCLSLNKSSALSSLIDTPSPSRPINRHYNYVGIL